MCPFSSSMPDCGWTWRRGVRKKEMCETFWNCECQLCVDNCFVNFFDKNQKHNCAMSGNAIKSNRLNDHTSRCMIVRC